jgi:predicted esterase
MTDIPDLDDCTLSTDEVRLLSRVDERTERMDSKIDDVVEKTEDNAEKIATNRAKANRNTTVLAGYSAGLMAVLMWGADKISRVV